MNNDTSFDIIQESNPVQTVAQPKEDNEMLRATDRITALYCRLSVEDTKEDKKNGKEDLSKSLTRCRKSDSSDTGERQRARAVRFRAWCSALIADRSSTTPPPTTLKSGRTFSSAPRTEPTRTSAAGITSEPSFWRMWSGNT